MGLLNKVASQVPLYEYGDAVVKPKKSCKRKIVSPTKTNEVNDRKCKEIIDEITVSEENATGDGINNPKKRGCRPKNVSQEEREKEDDMINSKKRGCRPKNVSQEECEKEDDMINSKKRGCRPKNVSQEEHEKEDDVIKPKKRGCRPKNVSQEECEKEDDVFEQPKRGQKPKCDNTVVTRKRDRPKAISPTEHVTDANVLSEPKRKNVSSASTQRHEADMVNTNEKQKRKLYTRESKDKGKQFIKCIIGKNKKVNSTKRGTKFDLESELNDIDVMIDEMNTGGKSLTEDSTDEVVDLNKWDDMEVEVKAIGICTFGSNRETNAGNEIEI